MSRFEGFREEQITNPRESTSQADSSSNSEVSDFETAADTEETTPTRSYSNPKVNTVQKKRSEKSAVRQLIEHFSSDSEATSETTRLTRKRKSLTAEHIELPPGGEKEIRRKMADQGKADQLVQVYRAMSGEFATSMNETDQTLNNDPSRSVMVGHMVSLNAEFEDLEIYWKKIEEINEKPGVNLEFVNLVLARNKLKTRYNRVKGLIQASTEKDSNAAPTAFKIMNPTSFGNILLPDFSGDYVEFDNFEALFKNLIDNGNLDDGGKLAHLLHHLKGEAREFIGHDGLAEKTYEQVWLELKSRYGKPWRITRAAVKKILDIKDPSGDPADISRYWNQVNETCKVAERLKLSATSVILNMALLKLPTDFRSKMDDKLKVVSEKYILTREQVAEPFNDIIAGEAEKPRNVIATLGFNTATAANSNNPNTRGGQQPNKHGLSKGKTKFYCYLCTKGGHKTPECPIYTSGPRVQSRLREMGRCIRCGVPFKEHGQECSHRAGCRDHPGERHLYYACHNYRNIHHTEPRPLMLPSRPTQPLGNRNQQSGQQNA